MLKVNNLDLRQIDIDCKIEHTDQADCSISNRKEDLNIDCLFLVLQSSVKSDT